MSHRVFAYGTLKWREIARAVTGQEQLATVPAMLEGYARYSVKRAPYPGIVPQSGGQVRGVVYTGVDSAALTRIDEFEGDLYRRESVTVATDGGRQLEVYAYIVRRRYRSRLTGTPWDEDAFARRWLDAYVRACRAGSEPG